MKKYLNNKTHILPELGQFFLEPVFVHHLFGLNFFARLTWNFHVFRIVSIYGQRI